MRLSGKMVCNNNNNEKIIVVQANVDNDCNYISDQMESHILEFLIIIEETLDYIKKICWYEMLGSRRCNM